MRLIAAIVWAIALTVTAHAAEQKFPLADGQIHFNMPSGNVGCVFTQKGGSDVYMPEDGGPELQCDRREPKYIRVFLHKSGKAERYENVGDVGCCGADNILRYGNSWSHAGYRCVSTKTGLTCTRGKSGFFLSRSKTTVY